MGKEIKEKININSVDVFFIGEDLSIFHSLKDLSSKLETFLIEKTNFSKNIITNNSFFLIDDSIDKFSEKISFLHKKKFENFFILLKKENLGVFEKKNYKIFLKPLKIFELHKEISNKISKNVQGGELWKLDRGKLKFYKNNKNYIDKETQTERDNKEDKNLETDLTLLEIEGLLQYKEDINSINLNRYKWKFLNIIY